MEAASLKNYGRSWIEAANGMPPGVMRRIRWRSLATVAGRVGPGRLHRFGLVFRREQRRMSAVDLSFLREKGLTDRRFIREQVEYAALFSALRQVQGERAGMETLYRVVAATAWDLFEALFPGVEDFLRCSDPWAAYRHYMIAGAEADGRDGAHVFRVVADSEHVLQLNCTWCAWYEIHKALGVPEACTANCYGDEVVMPEGLRPFGVVFRRETTLARGGTHCDFRFERKEGRGARPTGSCSS